MKNEMDCLTPMYSYRSDNKLLWNVVDLVFSTFSTNYNHRCLSFRFILDLINLNNFHFGKINSPNILPYIQSNYLPPFGL